MAVLAVGLLVGSVVGLTRSRDTGTDAPVGPKAVEIAGFAFEPDQLVVSMGDTVTWTNRDNTTHTTTGRGTDVIDSPDIAGDDTFELTFDEAGSFEYFCKFHPFMKGTVTVEG